MTVLEQEVVFRPPLPRPPRELWQARYQLSRHDFLAAVEVAVPRVSHPVEGLHWEYEGFRRGCLYILQSGELERELFFHSVEFDLQVIETQVIVSADTASEIELQLFRRMTTELDDLGHVAKARITPCTFVGLRFPFTS